MAEVVDRPREIIMRTEQAEDDHVRLSVKDVGVGVAPGNLNKLFEPFYTTKRDGIGDGVVGQSLHHRATSWADLGDPERRTGVDGFVFDSERRRALPPTVFREYVVFVV